MPQTESFLISGCRALCTLLLTFCTYLFLTLFHLLSFFLEREREKERDGSFMKVERRGWTREASEGETDYSEKNVE